MEITNAQRDKMLHAVGGVLDGCGHRNYYCAGEPDPDWEALVEGGLAVRQDRGPELGGICYHVVSTGYNVLRELAKQVKVDRARWLRNNAQAYRRRGGPSQAMADNLEACAKEMEEMREALREIASQKLRWEMDADHLELADFEGAYDAMIDRAREVVGPLPKGGVNG